MLREYFLLTDATATAKRIPEDVRKSLEKQLRVARQRAEAADALWSNGHGAEGLRLAADSFRATLGVAHAFSGALGLRPSAPPSEPAPPEGDSDAPDEESTPATEPADSSGAWRAALESRHVGEPRLGEVTAAAAALDGTDLPGLDDDVTAKEGALFQKLVATRLTVDRALSPATLTPSALLRMRVTRIGVGLVVLVALIAGATAALWPKRGEFAQASGTYNAEFGPANAIDGDPATEWLLPNGQNGWIEVELLPARAIRRLRLKNAHNRHHNDRAAREYRVEFYGEGALVETIEGEWTELDPTPSWTEHEVDLHDIDRIRVEVVSHHDSGGGLAEIAWE